MERRERQGVEEGKMCQSLELETVMYNFWWTHPW